MAELMKDLPLGKRLGFALVVVLAFLVLLEGALALAPWVMRRAHGSVAVGPEQASVVVYCAGDSVTYGLDLEITGSYPWQLADKLKASGLNDTRVMMVARPGAIAENLRVEVLPQLKGLPVTQRPVVYAMYGHNDFFTWDPESTRGAFTGVSAPSNPRLGHGLRIVRLLGWFRTAVDGAAPNLDMDEGKIGMLRSSLADTTRYLRDRGGELVLMTYVVPPEPPTFLPANTAKIIHLTHIGQPVINAKLRELAGELDIEVLDLDRLVDTGAEWNTTWWVDNIHLSALGLGVVADEVQAHLLRSGLLAKGNQGAGG